MEEGSAPALVVPKGVSPATFSPRQKSLRALNRFGLGARMGEAETIGDPQAWLSGQLTAAQAVLSGGDLPTLPEIGAAASKYRQAVRSRDQETRREAVQGLREIARREGAALIERRLVSEAPFVERLVAFWSDHLCISVVGKLGVVPLAGHYEREVIRPHVLGRFEEMVLASARHPAMLIYLDNIRSIGPSSPASRRASRRGRNPGLNENYARELLELHTLGVNGGYTQKDVEQLARILTGWTVAGVGPRATSSANPTFVFQQLLHEPGSKTVLGTRYQEEGVREGEKVIRDLCRHPSTAKFVAGKLVRHFVSDDPPPAAVSEVARAFSESGGDLLKVSRLLIELEQAWDPGNHKFRTPQDWLIAALRAVSIKEVPPPAGEVLRQLRQPLWAPPSPKGFGDAERDWADPDSLMNRAELSRSVSKRLARTRFNPAKLVEVVLVADGDPLASMLGDKSIARDERIALALAGPAFQWR